MMMYLLKNTGGVVVPQLPHVVVAVSLGSVIVSSHGVVYVCRSSRVGW